ncbi:MAG TPA: class I SAM-dependent methyltransferase [Acidimicrobiales bacterium]|jgi:ubiquinone/menaquinone biosynthesis C-methylase UbiE
MADLRSRLVTALDRARARLAPPDAPAAAAGPATAPAPAPGRDGYGSLWSPTDETQARALILNETDPEVFESSGKRQAEEVIRPLLRDGSVDVVLDLGCGIGRVARYVAPMCRQLWAVDASDEMLAHAARRLSGLGNVRVARCTGTTMPDVPDREVDVAYSVLTLQHLEREDAFLLLRELHRVVRPGGTVFLTFPNLLSATYLDCFVTYATTGEVANRARARLYTPQEVGAVLPAAGLTIERMVEGTEIEVVARRDRAAS